MTFLNRTERRTLKEIKLTKGYVALVDDEDFERCSQFKWRAFVTYRTDGTIRTV
jgi:hypothetical protein